MTMYKVLKTMLHIFIRTINAYYLVQIKWGDNNKNNSIVQVSYRKNFLTTKSVKLEQIVKAPPQFLSKSGFNSGVVISGGRAWGGPGSGRVCVAS